MVCSILVCRADSTSLILSELIVVATSFRAKCRDFILPVHLDTSTRPPFLWIFSAVEPLDVTCLHSVTLYLTYSTDLPMYMYQALLAALLSPIVVADSEYLVSLFVKYLSTTMQYVNLLIELPSIRRQQSQQIQTQYRRKYKACTSSYQKKWLLHLWIQFQAFYLKACETIFIHESHNKREDFTSIRFANTLCPKSLPNV